MDDAVEPFSPRALFLVAHHAQWSGAYFQRVLLAARLVDHPDPTVARYQQALLRALREEARGAVGLVVLADALARAHGVTPPPAPRAPGDWEPWLDAVAAGFKERLDLSRPESAPFRFGWDTGQVRTTLAALVTSLEILARGVDLRPTIVVGVKDLAAAARRWPAGAVMLAALPGGRSVAEAWRPAQEQLEHLARSDVGAADARSLDALGRGARALLDGLAALEDEAQRSLPSQA